MLKITLHYDGKLLDTYSFQESESPVSIGRDPGQAIQLDSLGVKKSHAEFRFENGAWNMVELAGTVEWVDFLHYRIGKYDLTLS